MKEKLITLLILSFLIFSASAQVKKILLEEMTTTLCGFCPPKSIDLERLADTIPEAVVVVHHAGFGKDAMTNAPATAFAGAFSPGHFPSMTIDRIKFDSAPGYYTKYVGVSMMAFKWADTVLAILKRSTPEATVSIEKSYNSSKREITGQVKVKFLKKPEPGDLRINLYVLEDSVTGDTGKYDYDQKNYITNDSKYPELFGKSVIYYKAHNDVVREAPLGNWGAAGVIPADPSVGVVYSKDFTCQLPVKYDTLKGREVFPDKIYLVAFVSYYDSDTWKRRVLNAEKVNLMKPSALEENELSNYFGLKIYPNPARNAFTYLNFNLLSSEKLEAAMYDMQGKKIATLINDFIEQGNYTLKINTSLLPAGMYIITMVSETSSASVKMNVLH